MRARHRMVPAVPSWIILSQRYADDYPVGGKRIGKGKTPPEFVSSGYLKQADTIEALAAQINVVPAALKATVQRWNGFVDKGADEDFGRGTRDYDKWLGDPLYACGVSTSSIMGGVYPGAGASVGPSMTFGYIAAKHAAGVDNSM
ncbi:MAG: hypothetical protein ABI673_00440 [Novosphingobium sp.]